MLLARTRYSTNSCAAVYFDYSQRHDVHIWLLKWSGAGQTACRYLNQLWTNLLVLIWIIRLQLVQTALNVLVHDTPNIMFCVSDLLCGEINFHKKCFINPVFISCSKSEG